MGRKVSIKERAATKAALDIIATTKISRHRSSNYYSKAMHGRRRELIDPSTAPLNIGLSIPADLQAIRRISQWPLPELFFEPSNFEHRAILRKGKGHAGSCGGQTRPRMIAAAPVARQNFIRHEKRRDSW
jgi:hypothetical protein